MEHLVKDALKQYELINPEIKFIRHNENLTYKVICHDNSYLLRIHKPINGFDLNCYRREVNPKILVEEEIELLDFLSQHMRLIQQPIQNRKGNIVSIVDNDIPVSLINWIDGEPLNEVSINEEMAYEIGQMVAKLHKACKTYSREGKRYSYDQSILSIIKKELLIAEEKEQINKTHIVIMSKVLKKIADYMRELDEDEDMFGYIHGDLSLSNIISSSHGLLPIDFSLSGYGYYYMDLGILISQIEDKDIIKGILRGYETVSGTTISVKYIEAFFTMGILLFIGAQHNKVYKESWFSEALNNWSQHIFEPFINSDNFVL